MKIYCNKCNKEFKSMKELNDNEIEELKENGSFVCSTCINKEMLNEDLLYEADKDIRRVENRTHLRT